MTVQHGKLVDLGAKLASKPIDLFVGSASFESRCLSVPYSLDVNHIGRAIVGVNLTYKDVVDENFGLLRKHFADRMVELPLAADDPILSADKIASVVGPELSPTPKRIVIDVTAFTRESLLMLLGFLRPRVNSKDELFFVYAHAKEYSVGDPPDKKWLSKGLRDVRSVLGFPGRIIPSRKTHLIVLVGFEDDRALDLIRECEPSVVSLGFGDPSEEGTGPHHLTNLARFKKLRSILGAVNEFSFRAYSPEGTRDGLRSQIDKFLGYNVIVAPMNTKISTIGAALLAFEDEAVQICYAPANIYNVSLYSSPDDDFYLFQLPGFPQ